MSESKIRRKSKAYTAALATTVSGVVAIPMTDMAGGLVSIGTVSTSATGILLYASDAETGSYAKLYDSFGSLAKITLAPSTAESQSYALPDAAFGAQWIKLVSETTSSTGVVATITMKG